MNNFYNTVFQSIDATNARRFANNATTNATDQYEADVAEYLSNEAGNLEKGIAGLLNKEVGFKRNLGDDVTASFDYNFGNDQANMGIEKRFANGGMVSNNNSFDSGISGLPMSEQGDTLTTQIFQAGFRPRR